MEDIPKKDIELAGVLYGTFAEDNSQKAVEVIEKIYGKFENVQLFPGMGADLQE